MSGRRTPLRVAVVTPRQRLARELECDGDFELLEVAERPHAVRNGADAVLVDAHVDLDAALRHIRETHLDAMVIAVGVPSDAAHRVHRLGYDGVFPAGVAPAGRLGDVVRRALASRALERSELIAALAAREDAAAAVDQSLRALVDAHADGILVVDPEGIVRFANHAARALLGQPGAPLEGSEFGLPLEGDAIQDVDLVVAGEAVVTELRTVDITWDGHPSVLCLLRDVTDRRRRDERLRSTAATLEAVLATIPDGVVELDGHGQVRRWNEAAERLLGWGAADVEGERCPFLPRERVEALAASAHSETLEVATRADGPRRLLVTSRPLPDGGVLLVLSLSAAG